MVVPQIPAAQQVPKPSSQDYRMTIAAKHSILRARLSLCLVNALPALNRNLRKCPVSLVRIDAQSLDGSYYCLQKRVLYKNSKIVDYKKIST